MIAVLGCILAFLLHTFDRLDRRYAIDMNFGDCLPGRWLVWGFYGEREGWARNFAKRYAMLRLPSRAWAYDPCYDEYFWGQYVLMYLSSRGWRLHVSFDPKRYELSRQMEPASVWVPPEGYKGW